MSELWYCKTCREYHEATTEEIASYICPNKKTQGSRKVLDVVLDKESFKRFTESLEVGKHSPIRHSQDLPEKEKDNGKETE